MVPRCDLGSWLHAALAPKTFPRESEEAPVHRPRAPGYCSSRYRTATPDDGSPKRGSSPPWFGYYGVHSVTRRQSARGCLDEVLGAPLPPLFDRNRRPSRRIVGPGERIVLVTYAAGAPFVWRRLTEDAQLAQRRTTAPYSRGPWDLVHAGDDLGHRATRLGSAAKASTVHLRGASESKELQPRQVLLNSWMADDENYVPEVVELERMPGA